MTVRLKLTLVYGGLFIAAGLILITLSYGLIRLRSLDSPPRRPIAERIEDRVERDDIGENDIENRVDRARRDERATALRQVWRQSLLALLVMTFGALLVGWLLAGKMLSPIRRITAHAQSSSATTLGERIRLEGPDDELKDLADTFDAMLDRLQAAFRAQQGFAAQASHELRTPLSIIRAEAELAAAGQNPNEQTRQTSATILRAVERSEELVEGLLALTQSESTMLDEAVLDMADLAGDVVGEHVQAADMAGVRLDLSLETASVRGDEGLLTRMVANLLQNAIRYNLPGGSVQVSVRRSDASVELRVENTGPAMEGVDIDTLFQPFMRGDWARRNRGGHGLGLAIVRSVAIAHRGEVNAEARPGGGMIVRVRLPAA
jgi:signal transduction histidine kinase